MVTALHEEIHLTLQQRKLAAATEWVPQLPGWLFVRIDAGDGCILHHSGHHLLAAGDMLVLRHSPTTALRASQLGELRLQFFQVVPGKLTGVLSPLEHQHLEQLTDYAPPSCQVFPAADTRAQQFAELAHGSVVSSTLHLRWQMLNLALPILAEKLPKQTSAAPEPASSAAERFTELIRTIPEEAFLKFSPAKLAQRCGCVERHFSRLFRAHFHCSFAQRKMELRLQKAVLLLQQTDQKIVDVALDSGFQHVGLFNFCFKRRFKMTPSRLRLRHRAAAKKPLKS